MRLVTSENNVISAAMIPISTDAQKLSLQNLMGRRCQVTAPAGRDVNPRQETLLPLGAYSVFGHYKQSTTV